MRMFRQSTNENHYPVLLVTSKVGLDSAARRKRLSAEIQAICVLRIMVKLFNN